MKKIQLQTPTYGTPLSPKFVGATNENVLLVESIVVPAVPAGPPPPSDNPADPGYVYPTTAEGFLKLSIQAGKGPLTDKAQLWATVAQTMLLEELVGFLRRAEDNETPSGLAEAIADGILMAQQEAEKK